MGLKNSLKKPIKSLFLKATGFLFLPLLGFVLFSWLTYPLKPNCSLSQGLLGCIPRCEPVSFFEDGNPASYKETPCFHEEPSPFQLAIFNYRLLIPLILFVSVSFWVYKDGLKKVIGKLAYIAFAPFFIFKENRENRNIISRLLVIIIIFFLVVEWALGYYVVFATFTGKDLFTSSPPQSQTQVAPLSPSFTGQEVFDAVNKYRKENGVSELKLDEVLCNNIAQRYLDIKAGEKENIAHKGFDEWYKKYAEPYGYAASEDYACGQNPEDIINAWNGSPSHKLSILNEKNKLACAYAFSGCAVLILGYKNSSQTGVKGVSAHDSTRVVPDQDIDPIVMCDFTYLPDQKMKSSECSRSFECQVGGQWYIYTSRDQCKIDQDNYWRNKRSNVQDGQNTNSFLSQEEYKRRLSEIKIECKLDSPPYFYDFGQLTYEECKQKGDAYFAQKRAELGPTPELGHLEKALQEMQEISNYNPALPTIPPADYSIHMEPTPTPLKVPIGYP